MQTNNKESMPAKKELPTEVQFVNNMPVSTPTDLVMGSLTTGNFQPPNGEVMKLTVTKLGEAQPDEPEQRTPPPLFGTHIREGVAVVKDWMKKP